MKSFDQLIRKKEAPTDVAGALSTSSIRDITEYGRSVHAEMSAICDAARTGRSLQGATLFCTTFPCHNCTKHILSAGIRRVVFIEPYPKSRAQTLYDNEIDFAGKADDKVKFEPFFRYFAGDLPHDIPKRAPERPRWTGEKMAT
ncbi:MAG: deaminase [Rhodospirillales bacterium]